MPLPENDNVFMTRGKMIQDIMVSLGGRIAEELILDDITTGASQDIKQVTQYARAMVTKFGMSDELGLINYDSGEGDEVFFVKLGKWSNVYLTGGGLILNKGGKDFLAGKLHRIIREAQRTNNKMTSHVFSSAVGLTILVVTTQEEQKAPEGGAKGLFSRAFRWLMGY